MTTLFFSQTRSKTHQVSYFIRRPDISNEAVDVYRLRWHKEETWFDGMSLAKIGRRAAEEAQRMEKEFRDHYPLAMHHNLIDCIKW